MRKHCPRVSPNFPGVQTFSIFASFAITFCAVVVIGFALLSQTWWLVVVAALVGINASRIAGVRN